MHVIFAAALLAQIHTGQDLLTACTATDTASCDAFIQQVISTTKGAECFQGAPPSDIRKSVLQDLQANDAKLSDDATAFVARTLTAECESAE